MWNWRLTVQIAVRFEDHSAQIIEMIERKLRAGLGEAARVLGEEYQTALLAEDAPPHSKPGQIPHAYLGHKPGGFGPLNGPGEINNTTKFGFSSDQQDNLASYIHGTGTPAGQRLQAIVGFSDSHVTRRSQNYLIQWDQAEIQGSAKRRPWVRPVYDKRKTQIVNAFKAGFREAT
jgi:hypothetical protein